MARNVFWHPEGLRPGSSKKLKIVSSHFCTLVFESWKTNIGRGALHRKTKNRMKGLFMFLLLSSVGSFPVFADLFGNFDPE